jgi:hypothetical protein
MPHHKLVRILRQTTKIQEELLVESRDRKVGTSVSDYTT